MKRPFKPLKKSVPRTKKRAKENVLVLAEAPINLNDQALVS